MNEYSDTEIRKSLSLFHTETLLSARFRRNTRTQYVWSTKPLTMQEQNKPVELIVFPNQGLMTLNDRFSLYEVQNYDYILNGLYDCKKAMMKLNKRMKKRRTVTLPNKKRPCLISELTKDERSVQMFVPGSENEHANSRDHSVLDENSEENARAPQIPAVIIKRMKKRRTVTLPNKRPCLISELTKVERSVQPYAPGTENEQTNSRDHSVLGENSEENATAPQVPSVIIQRSHYKWKRKRILTKDDLDNELDTYMADIKLKEDD